MFVGVVFCGVGLFVVFVVGVVFVWFELLGCFFGVVVDVVVYVCFFGGDVGVVG